MDFFTPFVGASRQTLSSETVARSHDSKASTSRATPIFSEYDFAGRYGRTTDQRSVNAPLARAASARDAPAEHRADNLHQDHTRMKRGNLLGTCFRSEFRECRGGEALDQTASSHVRFDQFERAQTRGDEGRGTCEGIARETLRRIDRSYTGDGQTSTLPLAVDSMNNDMDRGGDNATSLYHNIDSFQSNPTALGLRHYRQSSELNLNVDGTSPRETRIEGLLDSMGDIPPGGLAYVRVGIQRTDASGPADSGHVLLIQHLPDDAHGAGNRPADRYAIFDPNNGVFTYDSLEQMRTGLRGYMNTAYSEDNYAAAPNRVLFFSPPSSRDWGALPETASVPPPNGNNNLLEPPDLLNFLRPHLASHHDELR